VVVRANVNGEWREADVWPGASLLTMLRDHLGLYGSKNACEQGECGSCSIWLDGELVCACLVLAAQAHERQVRTVESLSAGPGGNSWKETPSLALPARGREVEETPSLALPARGREIVMHPVQEAFIEAGAVQCGFCTPGLVVAVSDLLSRDPNPNEVTVREALSGNLCRCTGYEKILDAVSLAATRLREAAP